jgi:hypothetical protein
MQQPGDLPAGALPVTLVFVFLIALGALLGWRNFRAKRGDVHGANRAAAFVFAATLPAFMLNAHHVAAVGEVLVLTSGALVGALSAAPVWALYLAFEPYVRRRWPQSMVTWSRVLNGRFRDPLVGGHLVFGVALGIGLALVNSGAHVTREQHYGTISGTSFPGVTTSGILSVLDARGLAGILLLELRQAFRYGMLLTFILMLFRVLLRRQWLAAASFVLLGALAGLADAHPGIGLVVQISFFALFAATMLRFGGLLPLIVCLFVGDTLGNFPIADFSTWYASTTVFVLVVVLALTAYAFHTALAGRPLFKAGLLEE